MQALTHYFLHFGFPFFIAFLFFRKDWKKVYLILIATMLVDLDHVFATPIFDPNRCSIGYHPLHSSFAILGYIVLLFLKRTYRIIGIGLLFHMLTDLIDCIFLYQKCEQCIFGTPAESLIKSISDFINI